MRYTLTSTQIGYFKREDHIEFEDFFSKEEAAHLKQLLDEAHGKNPSGYDLERENPPLMKALKLPRLGQVAKALCEKKNLRLAFTQYAPPYKKILSLEDISAVTETYLWALINLSPDPLPDFTYLPMEEGDIGFYKNQFPIDFTDLECPVLLVTFANDKARYKIQEKNPSAHYLKKLGYGFGDLLTDETHPTIK